MAKRVFFSFHYQDVIDFRANTVRNHGSFKLSANEAGYYDSSIWESAKKVGDIALKRLINKGLDNTSTTCVLIGTETYSRAWVRYELLKSLKKGNHILAVHINSINGKDQKTKSLGKNPLDYVGVYAKDKDSYHLVQKKNDGKWQYYSEIDSNSEIKVKHTLELNKTLPLSSFFNTYEWVGNDGFNNFKDWIE